MITDKLTPAEAYAAIKKIMNDGEAIEDRGTAGILTVSSTSKVGMDKDLVIFFITDDRTRGVMFPLTLDQAVEFANNVRKAAEMAMPPK